MKKIVTKLLDIVMIQLESAGINYNKPSISPEIVSTPPSSDRHEGDTEIQFCPSCGEPNQRQKICPRCGYEGPKPNYIVTLSNFPEGGGRFRELAIFQRSASSDFDKKILLLNSGI